LLKFGPPVVTEKHASKHALLGPYKVWFLDLVLYEHEIYGVGQSALT
jgi:hypothetical protein